MIYTCQPIGNNPHSPLTGHIRYDPISGEMMIYDGTQWIVTGFDDKYIITKFVGLHAINTFTVDDFFHIKETGVYKSINLTNKKCLWCYVYDDGEKLVGIYNLDDIKKYLVLSDEELTVFALKYGEDF